MQVAMKKTDGVGGFVAHIPQVCGGTHTAFCPSHIPSGESQFSGIFRAIPQLFCILKPVSPLALDSQDVSSMEKIYHRSVLQCCSFGSWRREVVSACTYQKSQGPLVKAPISKKNVKPLELVILLILIHIPKGFHCCCL